MATTQVLSLTPKKAGRGFRSFGNEPQKYLDGSGLFLRIGFSGNCNGFLYRGRFGSGDWSNINGLLGSFGFSLQKDKIRYEIKIE